MSDWISVDDRLPDVNTRVLVRYHAHFRDEPVTEHDICTAFFREFSFDAKDQGFYTKRTVNVTHWMPLPKPPSEVTDD